MAIDPEKMTAFRWNLSLGYGYCAEERPGQYNREYWDRYVSYRTSPIAKTLMKVRADLVRRCYGDGPLVDVGIGSGHFLETRGPETFGYDVNPIGVRWLLDRDLWWDPYARDPEAVTCWDVLEHMKRPEHLVACVRKVLFISIPIFRDEKHVLQSKHWKPGEHHYYFSREGLIRWIWTYGFKLVEENRMECQLGREDIGTFVFER
jgi:hypothetical protein